MFTFYIIGMGLAFIMGVFLYSTQEDKKNSQLGMIAPITLLSWITVIIIVWRIIKDNS